MSFPSRLRDVLSEKRPIHRAFLFAGGLLLLFLVVQLASASAEAPRGAALPDQPGGAEYTRTADRDGYDLFSVGNLIAFALLAGGGAWAYHLRTRTGPAANGPALIEPVGRFALAQNQQLRLVRCGGEVLLLGVTDGQISLLRSYDADAFADEHAAPLPAEPAAHGFADLLRAYAPASHA